MYGRIYYHQTKQTQLRYEFEGNPYYDPIKIIKSIFERKKKYLHMVVWLEAAADTISRTITEVKHLELSQSNTFYGVVSVAVEQSRR